MCDKIGGTSPSMELCMSMPELEETLQEGINIVFDWIINKFDIFGMLHFDILKGDLGTAVFGGIRSQVGSIHDNQIMNNLVLLRLTEMIRKRELCKVGEACQINSWRFNDRLSLMKNHQEVLGDSILCAGLVHIVNLGTRLVAFGGRDKGITKRHLGEHKGKSMKEAAKPVILMKL